MSKTASSPGKTMFVKEFLNDHPQGNVDAVNEAWQAAGFDGTISPTLINKMRASLGLTGNIRGTSKSPRCGHGEKRERRRDETAAMVNVQSRATRSHSPGRPGSRHRSADFQSDGHWRPYRHRRFVATCKKAALWGVDRRLICFELESGMHMNSLGATVHQDGDRSQSDISDEVTCQTKACRDPGFIGSESAFGL